MIGWFLVIPNVCWDCLFSFKETTLQTLVPPGKRNFDSILFRSCLAVFDYRSTAVHGSSTLQHLRSLPPDFNIRICLSGVYVRLLLGRLVIEVFTSPCSVSEIVCGRSLTSQLLSSRRPLVTFAGGLRSCSQYVVGMRSRVIGMTAICRFCVDIIIGLPISSGWCLTRGSSEKMSPIRFASRNNLSRLSS